MKTSIIAGLLGVGAGYIIKDVTTTLKVVEVPVPVVERITTKEVEIIHIPQLQPILVKPMQVPMLTNPNERQEVPSIDWESELLAGVKYFEGYKPNTYKCSGGKRTIGYGCTDKRVVAMGTITEQRATKELMKELSQARTQVDNIVTVDLTDYQRNALTSFTFNCGPSNLKQLVDGSNRLNTGDYRSVERLLPQYRKAGGKIRKGLERRREWEVSLWRGNPEI